MSRLIRLSNYRLQSIVILTALAIWALVSIYLAQNFHWRMMALFFIATLLGLTLYHAAFGFSGAYRAFILKRQTAGIEAQLLMLATASILFAPLLARGEVLGQSLGGALAPVGISVAFGAFIFGIGMQLGDGCASGTLYTVGGGNRKMLITLLSFVTGSVLATFHMPFWWALPSAGEISVLKTLGLVPAVLCQLLLIALIYCFVRRIGKRRKSNSKFHLLRGPWPLWAAAISLALLNLATLMTAGHPWSITWGFTLWGGKLAQSMGLELTQTVFWGSGFQLKALNQSLLADITSLMNFGLILGAAIAAGLAGRFLPKFQLNLRQLISAILGGLLMGYGARLAYGCNIGAFFSGVASYSLHGWIWILAALPGNWIGVKLRPMFKL